MGAGSRLVLRFEPLVLHCECRDLETAMRVVGLARDAGLRESGVSGLQRPIAALRCSIRLEVPARLPPSFLRPVSHLPLTPQLCHIEPTCIPALTPALGLPAET